MSKAYTVFVFEEPDPDPVAIHTSGSSLMQVIENAMDEYLEALVDSSFDFEDEIDDDDLAWEKQRAYDGFTGRVAVYEGHFEDLEMARIMTSCLYEGEPGAYDSAMMAPFEMDAAISV